MKYLIDYNMKGGGCFDVWCPLCGGPLNRTGIERSESLYEESLNKNNNNEFIKILKSQPSWFEKVSILFEGKKVKHGFSETHCNMNFENNSGEAYSYLVEEDKGIPVHTECYKLAKIKTGKELCFEDFDIDKFWVNAKYPKDIKKIKKSEWVNFDKEKSTMSYENLKKFYFESKLAKYIYYAYSDLNYNPIIKYWKQDFDLDTLKNKKSEWYLLFNPNGKSAESKKNADRIMKNIKKLIGKKTMTSSKKLKKDRPSPSESATEFKEGTKKKGNDGNMYIVVINKNGVKRWKVFNRPSPSESATLFKEGTKKKGNDGKIYIIAVDKNGVKRWKKL
jgi:hypothetical protein